MKPKEKGRAGTKVSVTGHSPNAAASLHRLGNCARAEPHPGGGPHVPPDTSRLSRAGHRDAAEA